jgi:hypothetical protein
MPLAIRYKHHSDLRQDRISPGCYGSSLVRLLLCIKNTPSIKYYHHVVPVDHLTPRLEEEGRINPYNAVASGLMALMLNAIALSPFSRINPYNNSERKKTLLPMTESLLLSSQEERKSRIEEERQERI